MPWLGPFTIVEISSNNTCSLKSEKGELKQRQNISNIKLFTARKFEKREEEHSPPVEENETADRVCTSWIKELHLTLDDRNIIENREMLTDRIIDAAHHLLMRQYPVNDIETPLLCQTSGFTPTQNPCVQIHYDAQRQHWITSSTTRQRVEVADSLSNGSISQTIEDQLGQKYSSLASDGILPVYLLPVRQQDNSTDCGVYAIANAVEFVEENGNPMAYYEIDVMRSHLIECLESRELLPFPKCSKKIRGRQPKTTVHNINL